MTANDIRKVYNAMIRARVNLHQAAEAAITARTEYETAKADRIISGSITGKNETEREANARSQMPDMYYEMIDSDKAEREAKRNFDIASLNVEMVRALLRLAEIEASAKA